VLSPTLQEAAAVVKSVCILRKSGWAFKFYKNDYDLEAFIF